MNGNAQKGMLQIDARPVENFWLRHWVRTPCVPLLVTRGATTSSPLIVGRLLMACASVVFKRVDNPPSAIDQTVRTGPTVQCAGPWLPSPRHSCDARPYSVAPLHFIYPAVHNTPCQLSLSSFLGRQMSSKLESDVCCRLQVALSGESYGGNRRPGRK